MGKEKKKTNISKLYLFLFFTIFNIFKIIYIYFLKLIINNLKNKN